MKLKKALKPTILYPKRKYIKPIFINGSVAIVLTACVSDTSSKTPNSNEVNTSVSQKQEIPYPDDITGVIVTESIPLVEINQTEWHYAPKK